MKNKQTLEERLMASRATVADWVSEIQIWVQEQTKNGSFIFAPGSPLTVVINGIAGLIYMLLYYIEDVATEQNIFTASRERSVQNWAALSGYPLEGRRAATGRVKFIPRSGQSQRAVELPLELVLEHRTSGIKFTAIFNERQTIQIENVIDDGLETFIVQGEWETQNEQSNGKAVQAFEISSQAADINWLTVYIGGEKWDVKRSWFDLGDDEPAVAVTNGYNGRWNCVFGNGLNGRIPPKNSSILFKWINTNGEKGNMDLGLRLTSSEEIESAGETENLTTFFDLEISEPVWGGRAAESAEWLKQVVPLTSKSNLILFQDDLEWWLKRLQDWALLDVLKTKRGWTVKLEEPKRGKAFFPDWMGRRPSTQKLEKIEAWLKEKIPPDVDLTFMSPGKERFAMDVILDLSPGEDKRAVGSRVYLKLAERLPFLVNTRQKLTQSTIIKELATVDGIDSVTVWFISESDEKIFGETNGQRNITGLNDIQLYDSSKKITFEGDWEDRNGVYYQNGFKVWDSRSLSEIRDDTEWTEKATLNIFFT